MTALFALLLAVAPVDLAGLDSPSFRAREAAEAALRRRMDWLTALRLELAPPASPEARSRMRRAIDDWYQVRRPAAGWPRIDALFGRIETGRHPVVRHYLERQGLEVWYCGPFCCGYFPSADELRTATALFVDDMARLRVPPAAVRLLLATAAKRELDAGGPTAWRRMPDPLQP